jgi:ATP phosphoribosyltransferase regulatory subunit
VSAGAEAALARIAQAGGARIDPPTLLSAHLVLELSGEAVRSRLCIFPTDTGEELCLRPDLTTPIAAQIADGWISSGRYHAMGPVYRLPLPGSDEPVEHVQAGFEWFGGAGPDEDAEALAVALEAAKAGGVKTGDVRFGDVALYRAVVNALDFSPRWKERLVRAFARGRGPRELLSAGAAEVSPLASSIAAMGPAEAVNAVEAMLSTAGLQVVGGRGPEEIAERLRDKAQETAPPAKAAKLLLEYLAMNAPASGCVAQVEAFAKGGGLNISAALDGFRRRLERIESLKPAFWSGAKFSAEAGRRFDYYDGFVFDLTRAAQPSRPLVSGGRYDGLIGKLSGGKLNASAIGAALRADRLAEGAQ